MTKKDIGQLITNTIDGKKVSRYAIITATKVQRRVIKGIESGENAYAIDSLLKICDFLGLEVKLEVNVR